jgi:large subunit ribosomal protein L21
MYAVIKAGGKQEQVSQGQRIQVELLHEDIGSEVSLQPVCLVSEPGSVLATPSELDGVKVLARVVGEAKGPKITGFTYKPKSNNRRRWGHRQRYSVVEITSIQTPRPGPDPSGPADSGVSAGESVNTEGTGS